LRVEQVAADTFQLVPSKVVLKMTRARAHEVPAVEKRRDEGTSYEAGRADDEGLPRHRRWHVERESSRYARSFGRGPSSSVAAQNDAPKLM
jgi:hypothetical protein